MLVAQLCPNLWPHGLQPARLLCPWDSPGKHTGVHSHSLLQGIFLTQGLNLGLLHCRQILYHLSHRGSPRCLIRDIFLVISLCPHFPKMPPPNTIILGIKIQHMYFGGTNIQSIIPISMLDEIHLILKEVRLKWAFDFFFFLEIHRLPYKNQVSWNVTKLEIGINVWRRCNLCVLVKRTCVLPRIALEVAIGGWIISFVHIWGFIIIVLTCFCFQRVWSSS